MPRHYILDEQREVVPAADVIAWAEWLETADDRRIVAQNETRGYLVSTVFIGLDYRFGLPGPPLVFEMMVFEQDGAGPEVCQDRFSTWDEAAMGHAHMVAYIAATGRPPGEEFHA